MPEKSPTNRVPGKISPYTQAMARCLSERAEFPPETQLVHNLTNLVQGRMLEYLADQICESHRIVDPQSRGRIVRALLGIFSEEFFALFRAKLEKRPDLALLIARRIIRGEFEAAGGRLANGARRPLDSLFPAIFRKYFEYRNLDSLLHIVETDAEIQKTVLLALLKQRVEPDSNGLYEQVAGILEDDSEGLCPNLFLAYVKENRIDALQQRIESGAWRDDREHLKQRIAEICGG